MRAAVEPAITPANIADSAFVWQLSPVYTNQVFSEHLEKRISLLHTTFGEKKNQSIVNREVESGYAY